jgi:hypothetical protein
VLTEIVHSIDIGKENRGHRKCNEDKVGIADHDVVCIGVMVFDFLIFSNCENESEAQG